MQKTTGMENKAAKGGDSTKAKPAGKPAGGKKSGGKGKGC